MFNLLKSGMMSDFFFLSINGETEKKGGLLFKKN